MSQKHYSSTMRDAALILKRIVRDGGCFNLSENVYFDLNLPHQNEMFFMMLKCGWIDRRRSPNGEVLDECCVTHTGKRDIKDM